MALVRTHVGVVFQAAGTVTNLSVTAPAIPIGALAVIYYMANATAESVTPSDSDGVNTWATVANAGASSIRGVLGWTLVTNAIESGDLITVTLSTARAFWGFSADYFEATDGFLASPLDIATPSANGSSTSPSSGTSATTAQASELAVGVVAALLDTTLTPGSGWSAGTGVVTTGAVIRECFPLWKELTTTTTVAADGTLGSTAAWSATVATFKMTAAAGNIFGPHQRLGRGGVGVEMAGRLGGVLEY